MSDMNDRVVARSTSTGKELWSHKLTGRPFIDYVPATAFQMIDTGEATLEVEKGL